MRNSLTYHFECTAKDAAVNIRVPQTTFKGVFGQLDKLGKRVLVEHQGEFLVIGRPGGHRRRNVQKHLKANLSDSFGRIAQVRAAPNTRARQKVLNQALTDIVSPADRYYIW